jgi:uncharacterized protein
MNHYPTINFCYELLNKYSVPHIIEHSEQVMHVALLIYDNLKNRELDKNLIKTGSLLHDISKYNSITTNERHDITGSHLIKSLGYDKIAEIIEEHVKLNSFNPSGPLLEKEIVFYADKRVTHNKIVSLDERINDLLIRYGKTTENRKQILENKDLILKVEIKINNSLKKNINIIIK